jgi:hypothetical protein
MLVRSWPGADDGQAYGEDTREVIWQGDPLSMRRNKAPSKFNDLSGKERQVQ